MATYQHPATLNPLQQFAQACAIFRNTSRAKNPAWYQEALDLELQLHIRADGASISAFYYDRTKNVWSNGPLFNENLLHDPERMVSSATEILKHARSSGATALGVILHIADEFATTELKPELNNPASLPELKSAAISDPASILDDSSIPADQASWRVLPYSAAGGEVIGTTITLSRQYGPFLASLAQAGEEANFPVITHALSAPLVAMMGIGQTLEATPGKPFVAILQYPWFTAMAFFNEHADLRLVRTLQHRGLRRPSNFRHALSTTNASLEFVDPDLYVLPLGNGVDPTLVADLMGTFSSSRVEAVTQMPVGGLPAWSPEPAIANLVTDVAPKTTSHTFAILREDKWALQNFLPTPVEQVQIYPTAAEMKLLRFSKIARVAVLALSVLSVSWMAVGIIGLIRQPEWAFDPSEAGLLNARLARLTAERKNIDHWNNLLEDRSKAWTSMESLARLFPEKSGVLVKTYQHASKPEKTDGAAKMGLVKEWKITGYARDEALDYLNTLNTREGISAHFNEVAKATGSPAFGADNNTRSLVVNLRTQENGSFKPSQISELLDSDEATYPFTFDLTIVQRFEGTDPMAVTVAKAP